MTVRDVAERAGVNHALIHRHLGTKEALIRAAIAHSASASYAQVQRATRAGARLADLGDIPEIRRHLRLLARCILELDDLSTLQDSFPTVGDLVRSGTDLGLDPDLARARVVTIVSMISGVQLYATWFAEAAGLPPEAMAYTRDLLDVGLAAVDAAVGMPSWPSVWTD
jgi:AcrR family transcriptional regulator